MNIRSKFRSSGLQFKALFSVWNIALFSLALIPRLLWALEPHPPPFSDMEDYYLCAVNALRGEYLAMSDDRLAYRAPGYPLFLYTIFTLFPADRLLAVRLVQSVIDAFTVLVLFSIAKSVLKPLLLLKHRQNHFLQTVLAFTTALHYAWMSGPVFFSSILMTESLFTFLLLVWLKCMVSAREFNHSSLLIASSLLLGILALVRPISLCLLPVLIFFCFLHYGRMNRTPPAFIPLFCWLVPIVPWTIRNAIMLGTFVLLTTNSGVNFYIGHQQNYSYYNTGEKEQIRQELIEELGGIDEVAEDRYFFLKGLEEIAGRPHLLIQHSLQKLYYLFLMTEPPWPWREYGSGMGPRFYQAVPFLKWSWSPLLFLFTLAGIVYAFIKKLPHGILLSLIGLYTAACVFYFARTRFRLPIEPLLIFYAWLGIVSLLETGYSMIWRWQNLRSTSSPEPFDSKSFDQVKLR